MSRKAVEKEYEKAGKLLYDIAELGTTSRKKLLWLGFLRGVAAGVGSVLGATVVIALLLYILTFFEEIPFVGTLFETLRTTIQSD
jgi:Fe2+ transport system protein B